MTLQEWISKYEKKTGDKFVPDKRYGLFFLPDKGFGEFSVMNDMVVLRSMCGDIHFWRSRAENLAKKLGLHMCGTWCIRKEIKAYIRLLGYKATEEKLPDGRSRYFGVNKEGGRGWMSPAYVDKEHGYEAYFVTWEV